jgi:hypothetical protein
MNTNFKSKDSLVALPNVAGDEQNSGMPLHKEMDGGHIL